MSHFLVFRYLGVFQKLHIASHPSTSRLETVPALSVALFQLNSVWGIST